MTYLTPDIIDDETQLAEAGLAGIADRIPGWEPHEGHVEVAQAEATAVAIATAVSELKANAKEAYVGFGTTMLGIERQAATAATATSTWAIDTSAVPAGITIPAGTSVLATTPAGDTVELVTATDSTAAAGVASVAGVQLVAVESGPDANGATGPAEPEPLVGVTTVTITSPAAGGRDLEDIDDYANKVADRARRMHAIPVTPDDYAAFALDVPAVARCLAVNLYDPGPPLDTDAPGHIALLPIDSAGNALSAPNKTILQAYFDAIEKPLSATVHILDRDTVDTTVTVTVRPLEDAGPTDLQARVAAAITALLDKATFDADPAQPGGFAKPRKTELTIFDITASIDDLTGLAAVVDVTISAGDGERVALPAPLTLPNLTGVTVNLA